MNFKQLFLGAAAFATMGLATVSCTNEMVSPYPNGNAVQTDKSMLVHAPDVYAWSGQQLFNSTRSAFGTRAGEEIVFQVTDIKSSTINKDAEDAYIDERLPEKADNLPDDIDTDFLFYTTAETKVELYPVYAKTNNRHEFGIFYYTSDGDIKTYKLWDEVNPWGLYEDGKCLGKEVIIPAGVFFGFYIDKANWLFTPEKDYGMDPGKLYSSSNLNPESYHADENNQCDKSKPTSRQHAVTWVRTLEDGTTQNYLGFEDFCDFDFQDLVFTLTPEVKTVDASGFVPGETLPPTGGDNDDVCDVPGCGHPKHDGQVCDKCEEGTTCHPGTETPETPTPTPTPGVDEDVYGPITHNDEVEVNFSINDVHTDQNGQKYETADLWTKLSIHVRKGTDVRIHVPLPGRYLCESDDFAILQDHANGIYTGTGVETEVPGSIDEDNIYRHSMTYHIVKDTETSWDVLLHVDINAEGMDIWTDGIDEDLIDYLFEMNGDGMNFEIWNYYQTETVDWIDGQKHITPYLTEAEYEAFQGILDRSTIEFLDEDPSYYINAFGFNWTDGTYSQDIRPRDCLVTPSREDFNMFSNFCYHLNGTPWNIIWINKNVDSTSDSYKHHTITAEPAVPVDKY